MELWFEWEENNEEHLSFDDSDRFEEDSLCSWASEPESICGNWRGWKRNSQNGVQFDSDISEGTVETLIEICARTVAKHLPFETVERAFPQIPEQLQLRIAFWSFPPFEEDIRLYSCLANGSPDKFNEGENLLKVQAVKDVLQIGFHLSATVHQPHSPCQSKGIFNVAVTFDRGRITSCNCTCNQTATWCSHVIALCLFRIHFPNIVCLRAPVSEYLSRLRRDQLQKFAQYLISELPQQLLPTAQRLLDELLSSQESTINSVRGAPDPTAGPPATDRSKWCLDESSLHENIKKMLVRFCGPSPLVFSDVNALYLANTAPPTAAEWSNLLRPLRGREPEGMWNLLSIVRELFRRGDMNAVHLLVILTEECLANDQVLIWWFDSRSQASGNSLSHNYGNNYRGNTNAASTEATKHACAGFCDELVTLWRLAALNPKLSDDEREEIKNQLQEWHQKTVEKGQTGRGAGHAIPSAAMSCFPGFLAAIEACSLNWNNVDLGLVSKEGNNQPQLPLQLNLTRTPQSCNYTDADSGPHENVLAHVESVKDNQGANEENLCSPSADAHTPSLDMNEDLEVLCARTEALHVHGYSALAGKLAVKLAENILSDGNNLKISPQSAGARSKRRVLSTTSFANTILVKAGFLCNVLAEDLHCHHLAFRVGVLGLEMPRHPAKSKALEVKLLNQESDLVSLLKRLPLGPAELAIVKEKAELLHHGQLSRGEAVLPIMLSSFIFDVLSSSNIETQAKRQALRKLCETTKEDEELGFKAALYALGMKGKALENHYPMLCEGTRRQRGDLALAVLVYCRDDAARIRQIMDVLLDKNRYELQGVAGTTTDKKKVEGSDSQESKGEEKESEASGNSVVKTKATLVVPNRRVSQHSSTSDSGTDSSSKDSFGTADRCKARGGNVRPPLQRLPVCNASLSLDDESGSSSGVDTDSVPVPVREVAAREADLQRSQQNAVVPDGDKPLSDGPINTTLHVCVQTQTTQDGPGVNLLHKQARLVENPGMSHPNQNSSDIDGPPVDDVDKGSDGLRSENQGTPSKNVKHDRTSNLHNLTPDSLHLEDSKAAEPCIASQSAQVSCRSGSMDDAVQVCSPLGDLTQVSDPVKDFAIDPLSLRCSPLSAPDGYVPDSCEVESPSLHLESVDLNIGLPGVIESEAEVQSAGETSNFVNVINSNELPSVSNPNGATTSSFTGDRLQLNQRAILANQGLSSEGDVSDIEADFEESHNRVQQVLSNNAGSMSTLVNKGETGEVGTSALAGSVGDECSGTPDEVVQRGNTVSSCPVLGDERHTEGDAAVAAPSEAVEEQSSESGARGSTSASAEDTDRVRRRHRTRGRKRKKGAKSALYQATEAEAHFMFELAKTVLAKAGGNNGASVFTQPTSSDSQAGAHRVLQLCAFEIGLFALGLHNRTSANWLSRTYSSHVSWISGQAMEIGHQAITLLLERWEGNLTPSEVASIADRASRSNDRAMVRAAAELGLSCLHMATTLNPGEIQRALAQCREEDAQLLDQACQAVESAARGGGVYPEVLFDVAKHWYHLHERNQTNNTSVSRPAKSESRSRSSLSRSSQSVASSSHSPPISPFIPQVPQFTMPPSYSSIPPPLYTTPEQYVQQQMHQQVHQMMGHYPAYLPGRSYLFSRSLTGTQFSLSGAYAGLTPPPYQTTSVSSSSSQHLNRVTTAQQGTHVSYYLNSAYRVGMLALEFLSRRTSDDRPNVKFSRNPSCCDDIRWLCTLSAKLGTSHLQRFCVAALNAVASPFVLHDLALEAARHMARSNPAQLAANLRSSTISPLVQKSLTMYAQCIHYNLINISQSEYDEFVELLRHARGAFCMAPGGMTQFNELLQSIRWGHSKKKELWQMIITGLAKA